MKKILFLLTLSAVALFAAPQIGDTLQTLSLAGDNGGNHDGSPWHWQENQQHKATLLLYVDPDERDTADQFNEQIKKFEKDMDFEKFQIFMIINLNATWKPDSLIESLLSTRLKDYPHRAYIFDKESVLVQKWGLKDDAYNVLFLDKNGVVRYYDNRKEWSREAMRQVDQLVRSSVAKQR